jgi:hypothetical protein
MPYSSSPRESLREHIAEISGQQKCLVYFKVNWVILCVRCEGDPPHESGREGSPGGAPPDPLFSGVFLFTVSRDFSSFLGRLSGGDGSPNGLEPPRSVGSFFKDFFRTKILGPPGEGALSPEGTTT